MNSKKIYFGTDGWRALLDSEMNYESVEIIANAFVLYLQNEIDTKNISVAIGFDGRRNSELFAKIFAEVLSAYKIEVYLSDKIIPTPVLSYYVKTKSLNAGVMITASHNPPIYNGVKFKAHYGGPFLTEHTSKVENYINQNKSIKRAKEYTIVDMLEVYHHQIENIIDFNSIKKAGLKILVDSMSGAGNKILESFLSSYGIQTETIYGEPREDFSGRDAEPIEKNLIPLREKLISEKTYSIGLATDGDADRLGIMLDNGEWLSAQETILLLNDYVINSKNVSGNIVKTSSVTDKIFEFFQNENRKVYDVQVGFKYICEKMISEDIAIGCEESGGYGFKFHVPERDGILSGLLFTEMLAKSNFNKLSEYLKEKRKVFGNIYYNRIDYPYFNEDRNQKLDKLISNLPPKVDEFIIKKINKFYNAKGSLNGLKLILEGSTRWLLLRSSETEPMIRVYAEGQSNEEVEKILESGTKLITS